MRLSLHSLSFLAAFGLVACGGAEPTATTPTAATNAATAPAASGTATASTPASTTTAAPAAGVAFSKMTEQQQLQHMKTVIRPTMGKVFADFDAKKYGDFGCATCHGDKKEDPHKVLPKLTLSGDGFKKLATEKPALMKFMAEQVTPTMAKSMGEAPFDPATHKGFGCGGCHAVQ